MTLTRAFDTVARTSAVRFALGLALLLGCRSLPRSVAAASATATSNPSVLPAVRLETSATSVREGDTATLRIERRNLEGRLGLLLEAKGSATLGVDFRFEELGGDPKGTTRGGLRVEIPAGQRSVELLLHIVDDLPAEDDEEILLRVSPEPGSRSTPAASRIALTVPANDFVVTTTADGGEGSLRQAILNALFLAEPRPVTFDKEQGPFAAPQTITLRRPLPELRGRITIDGRIPNHLWKPHGVTISGGGRMRVLRVGRDADVTLGAVTLSEGRARRGGAILNRGRLVLRDSTLVGNRARRDGGAIANLGGELVVINSTFAANRAGRGGALANQKRRGQLTVTHATLTENSARHGGAIFNQGTLLLRNSILANSSPGADCADRGTVEATSTHNLIERDAGCGAIVTSADPRLDRLGSYNGPTRTIPLGGGSPAINLGDNSAALDEHGEPLRWDQRGNGDPRVVAGYADLGAFERQAFADLTVDTVEDSGLRGCTPSGPPDCSLRGAIELANSSPEADTITFDARRLPPQALLKLSRPLPEITSDLTLDAGESRIVTLLGDGRELLRTSATASLQLLGIETETSGEVPPNG